MVSSKSSDSVAEPDLGISCVKHMIFPSCQEWSEMGDIFFSRLIFPPLRGGIHPQLDQTNMLSTANSCSLRKKGAQTRHSPSADALMLSGGWISLLSKSRRQRPASLFLG